MMTRNKEFYDIVGKGLAALGYTGNVFFGVGE